MWEIGVEGISSIMCTGILLGLSVEDLWFRRISKTMLVIGMALALAYSGYCTVKLSVPVWIYGAGLLTGCFFLLLSSITKEAVGYGDSMLICMLGIYLGLWKLLAVLAAAWCMLAGAAMFHLIHRRMSRKSALPMVPFLTAGYVCMIIIPMIRG